MNSDNLHKIIRPKVNKWLEEGHEEPETDIHYYDCISCKHSLCFYDDIDPCCMIGFAGQEFLCPILQEEYQFTVDTFKLDNDTMRLIKED